VLELLGVVKELDLHNLKHEDVEILVENFSLLNPAPLRIITGNSLRMKNIVTSVLDKHDIQYDNQSHLGWIMIRGN